MLTSSSLIQTLFEDELVTHREQEMWETEEETMHMTWKQITWLLMLWDPLVSYSTWLHQLNLAMNDVTTAHKILAMCQPERNILKDLQQILLAADMDISSTYVETTRQRYIIMCN